MKKSTKSSATPSVVFLKTSFVQEWVTIFRKLSLFTLCSLTLMMSSCNEDEEERPRNINGRVTTLAAKDVGQTKVTLQGEEQTGLVGGQFIVSRDSMKVVNNSSEAAKISVDDYESIGDNTYLWEKTIDTLASGIQYYYKFALTDGARFDANVVGFRTQ